MLRSIRPGLQPVKDGSVGESRAVCAKHPLVLAFHFLGLTVVHVGYGEVGGSITQRTDSGKDIEQRKVVRGVPLVVFIRIAPVQLDIIERLALSEPLVSREEFRC